MVESSTHTASRSDLAALLHASNRSHAFILECKDVTLAYQNALDFAKGLNCHADDKPCQSCESCNKIEQANHPDVFTLEKQGKSKQISMDTIRQVLLPKLANLPHEGEKRVVIVRDCSQLVGPTNHALLKTLEEPPTRTVFVLCTSSRRTLLATVLSRCQFFKIPMPKGDESNQGFEEDHADIYDAFYASRDGKMSAIEFVDKLSALKDNIPNALLGLARRFHQKLSDSQKPSAIDAQTILAILKFRKRIHHHNAHATTALMAMMAEIKQIH